MWAIIGGSGLAQLPILEIERRQIVRTPYGETSCALIFGQLSGKEVIFLARHGHGHTLAPHEINYRANIWALHQQNADGIIAMGAVAGIRPDLKPGCLVVPDDIIDYTFERKHTFFDGPSSPVVHVDFSVPYDSVLRERLIRGMVQSGYEGVAGGVYACMPGPRMQTVAEIIKLERDGADMVGMTAMPEAVLAKELDIPYALLCQVSVRAAGREKIDQQNGFTAEKAAGVEAVIATLLAFLQTE